MVDQTAEHEASFIGSIWGWRLANWTCSEIPNAVLECISFIERSADSALTNVIKPRPFSISIDTLTILPNVENWLRKNSSVMLLPDTQMVWPVRCFSLRYPVPLDTDDNKTAGFVLSLKPRSSRSRSVAICWYTKRKTIVSHPNQNILRNLCGNQCYPHTYNSQSLFRITYNCALGVIHDLTVSCYWYCLQIHRHFV